MRGIMSCLAITAVTALNIPAPLAAQQSLSRTERQLTRYVDVHNEEALSLLERVVNINSGTMNFAGVREVGRVFMAELDALGFSTRWVDGDAFQRAGHLVAEHAGTGNGPRLLLIGHLDTVFEPDSPFQRFQLLNDSTATGPGIIDMKGGDVIIVQALKALQASGLLEDMSITVVMTGDEEKSGRPLRLARKALIDAARAADHAIAFEDGDGDPRTAVIARRGASGWQLETNGTPAHSSQIFRADVGAGAIYEAARILNSFYEELSGEPNLTFNPGLVVGGTDADFSASQARGTAFGKTNVVAESAVVSGDIRTLTLEQLESAKARMRAIVSQHRPHTSAQITFNDGYPPLAPTAGNKRLLQMFDRASRDLGLGPVSAVDPRKAGAADVSFTTGLVDMALDGIGLMGHDDHTVKETADLRTLPMQTKRAAVLLYRLARGNSIP
ncbi:MAG: M20/M25/M40 family metallo-hydrolase [Gemmatimonadales bacterium]